MAGVQVQQGLGLAGVQEVQAWGWRQGSSKHARGGTACTSTHTHICQHKVLNSVCSHHEIVEWMVAAACHSRPSTHQCYVVALYRQRLVKPVKTCTHGSMSQGTIPVFDTSSHTYTHLGRHLTGLTCVPPVAPAQPGSFADFLPSFAVLPLVCAPLAWYRDVVGRYGACPRHGDGQEKQRRGVAVAGLVVGAGHWASDDTHAQHTMSSSNW